ncbi:MAG: DEAD/DEAH box helicase [Candidatus Thalassarchaeaceae archaeon]
MEDEAGLEMVDLRDFQIDERLKKMLEENWGISQLFPPQARALPNSLDGRNLMLAIPTASGKSLVAHITMAHRLSNDLKGMRGVYIVPLKALASEKFRELSEICKSVDLKVGLAIGDRSSENNFVEDSDVLVCTSEKLDSMLRSNPSLMDDIGIVVADEFHLLQDPSRGPTLEILLSRIRHRVEGAQILALSATVGNANDLAEWLDADLVKSEWRPIALYSGTLTGLDLRYHSVESPGGDFSLPEPKRLDGGVNKNLHSVLDDTTEMSKQMLVFVASRSSAQKEARELSKHVKSKLDAGVHNFSDSVTESWDEMANSLSVRESGSVTAKALANAVRGGVGFHHAGLTSSQRRVVEEGFRTGNLLCIVATPTLAQGVNLPASRVVIRDSRRWSTVAARSMPLPVMEVRQMMGRAGRPGFDEFGESFLVSKSKQDEDSLIDLYLKGEPEDVTSKLANPGAQNAEEDGALLAHILSIVATAGIDDRDAISRFLSKTFLSSQMNPETLEARTDDVLYWLCENGMIERRGESKQVENRIKESKTAEREEDWQDEMPSWANSATAIPGLDLIPKEEAPRRLTPRRGPAIFGFKKASMYKPSDSFIPEPAAMTYAPTQLGARVSRLYLNPISGRIIQDGLRKAIGIISGEDNVGQVSPLSLLHLASCTPDFLPLWPRKNDYGAIQEVLHGREREFLSTTTDLEEERRMKGALVVNSWMDEDSLDSIENDWGVQAGDLRSRVELIEWLLYAMRRILSEDEDLGRMDRSAHKILYESIDEVHRRVRYGCKADILGLVAIRGVGRVRAREMSDTLGVNDASDLSTITERDKSRLSDLRGWSPKLVDKLVDSANKAVRRSR